MKVLQLGRFFPPDIGGIESVIYDLTVGLNDHGIRCDVICSNKINKTEIDESNGYKIIRTASIAQILSTSISFSQIIKLREIANQYDVIHVHHPDPMATLALFLSGFRNKVIVHWHSDIVRQKISFILYSPLQRWLLKRASRVIATSENYARASGHLKAFAEKIETIQIGTEVKHRLDDELLSRLKTVYSGRKVIFSLGRLVYYKGYEFLIEAAQHLDKGHVILIGGEGPLKTKLSKKIQDLKSGCEVKLLGRIPEEQLASYFMLCDIFCVPSIERSEAFGVVLLEAMYYSKPLVATNIEGSGVNWVNTHGVTGINVEPRNAKALAGAFKIILNDNELREKFGRQSLNRHRSNFTRAIMIERLLKLLERI